MMCCSIMINIMVELQLDGLFLPARQLLTTDAIFLYQLVHPGVHVEPICILQGHEAVKEEDRWVYFDTPSSVQRKTSPYRLLGKTPDR